MRELWLLAAAFIVSLPASVTAQPADGYVGSAACEDCHEDIYARWKKTRMANIFVDAREHPEAVLGDFSSSSDVLTFTRRDFDFTYGSKWKQRYFKKVGNDYFVLPAQWDVQNKTWRRYHAEVGADWWVPFYPSDNMQRPTGPLCDGCHSTHYDIATKQVTEWNVGCEKCHGPGAAHVADPKSYNIVNPQRLDFVTGNDVCLQCHTQGRPIETPLDGVYYDWPVGFQPGKRLSDYWVLEAHRLGESSFTHWPDGSAHKNRMQGNDYVQSVMYTRGIRCWACHDVHGTENNADLVRPANLLCLTCHGPQSPAGPRGGSLLAHSQHSAEKAQCVDCHMPKIASEIADVRVRSHTFHFITPAMSEQYGIPNPCLSCHTDQTTAWVAADLAKWKNVSPWRVSE